MTSRVRAYRGVVRMAVRRVLAYRLSAVVDVMLLVIQLYLLCAVWRAVYRSRTGTAPLELDQLLVYLTLVNVQLFALATVVSDTIQGRIRTGEVFFDLVRPLGYLRQMLGVQVGSTLGSLLLLVPALPVLALVGAVAPPEPAAGLLYLACLLVGYGVGVLLTLLVGLVAFWTVEVGGITLLYRLVSQFLAGGMAPLVLFPGWLRVLAEALPFRFTGYVPAAVYVGELSGAAAGRALLEGTAWLVVLALAVRLVWSRAYRRVVVQGG